MSVKLLAYCCLVSFILGASHALPAAFRNQLFDLDSSDTYSPEFARPDETGDLQRNSARLHRTLFLLDTSDLLKNARLFSAKNKDNSLFRREKREAKKPDEDASTKYIHVIKVRKPFFTVSSDSRRALAIEESP